MLTIYLDRQMVPQDLNPKSIRLGYVDASLLTKEHWEEAVFGAFDPVPGDRIVYESVKHAITIPLPPAKAVLIDILRDQSARPIIRSVAFARNAGKVEIPFTSAPLVIVDRHIWLIAAPELQ